MKKSEKKWYGGHEFKIKVHKTKKRPFVRVKYVDDSKKSGYNWKYEYLKGEPFSFSCYKSLNELKLHLGASVDSSAIVPPQDHKSIEDPGTSPAEKSKHGALVVDVFEAYFNDTAKRRGYRKEKHKTYTTTVQAYFNTLIKTGRLLLPFSEMPADQVSCNTLLELREYMIRMNAGGRKLINERISKIKSIFKYARTHNMISRETYIDISAIQSLAEDDARIEHPEPIHVPSTKDVEAVIDAACPTMRTLLILASTTAIRSQNVCNIRWDQIDESREESDGVWLYNPPVHKTSKVMDLTVVIGKRAMTALKNFRDMSPDAKSGYIFSRKVMRAWENTFNEVCPYHADMLKLAKLLDAGVDVSDRLSLVIGNLISALKRLRTAGWVIKAESKYVDSTPSVMVKKYKRKTKLVKYTVVKRTDLSPKDRLWGDEYKALKRSRLNDFFTNKNYNEAIAELCTKAVVKKFTAHKLRHYYTGLLCDQHSKAGAKAVVGHITERMTEHYSRRRQDVNLAIKVQQAMG